MGLFSTYLRKQIMSFSIAIPSRLSVLRGTFSVSYGFREEAKQACIPRKSQPLLFPACSCLQPLPAWPGKPLLPYPSKRPWVSLSIDHSGGLFAKHSSCSTRVRNTSSGFPSELEILLPCGKELFSLQWANSLLIVYSSTENGTWSAKKALVSPEGTVNCPGKEDGTCIPDRDKLFFSGTRDKFDF